jgi:hypothetical protein
MIVKTLNSIEEKELLIFTEPKMIKKITNVCGEELLEPMVIMELLLQDLLKICHQEQWEQH